MKLRFTALVVALALPLQAGYAQPFNDDRVIGYSSPIPEQQVSPTIGRDYDGLMPGIGREEVYYTFSPCLKTGWIKRQALDRATWLVEIDKMAKSCGLDALGNTERHVMADYLVANYGPQEAAD